MSDKMQTAPKRATTIGQLENCVPELTLNFSSQEYANMEPEAATCTVRQRFVVNTLKYFINQSFSHLFAELGGGGGVFSSLAKNKKDKKKVA